MEKRIAVKTPIFKGDNKKRIMGTADGWIDAREVQTVISGTSVHPDVQDSSAQGTQAVNTRTGNCMSVLNLKGGGVVLVMGKPVSVLKQLETALKEAAAPEASPGDSADDSEGVHTH